MLECPECKKKKRKGKLQPSMTKIDEKGLAETILTVSSIIKAAASSGSGGGVRPVRFRCSNPECKYHKKQVTLAASLFPTEQVVEDGNPMTGENPAWLNKLFGK